MIPEPDEAPEPEPESQNWREPAMKPFFSDRELGEMYRECQEFDPAEDVK